MGKKERRAKAGRGGRPRRAHRLREELPRPALRRHAAARRAGPRARRRPGAAALRRAVLGARPADPPRHAERGHPAAPRGRQDDGVHHPRPGGGAQARRPDHDPARRRGRPGRDARRGRRAPGRRLRPRLHLRRPPLARADAEVGDARAAAGRLDRGPGDELRPRSSARPPGRRSPRSTRSGWSTTASWSGSSTTTRSSGWSWPRRRSPTHDDHHSPPPTRPAPDAAAATRRASRARIPRWALALGGRRRSGSWSGRSRRAPTPSSCPVAMHTDLQRPAHRLPRHGARQPRHQPGHPVHHDHRRGFRRRRRLAAADGLRPRLPAPGPADRLARRDRGRDLGRPRRRQLADRAPGRARPSSPSGCSASGPTRSTCCSSPSSRSPSRCSSGCRSPSGRHHPAALGGRRDHHLPRPDADDADVRLPDARSCCSSASASRARSSAR